VANAGSNEVRVYGVGGRHVRTIGREGAGPGEFRYPRKLWHLNDTLLVLDLDRASYFDTAGTFIRSVSASGATPAGRFEDGGYLRVVFAGGQDVYEMGYSRPRMALVKAPMDGSAPDTLTELSGTEFYRISLDGRGVSSFLSPFGHERLVALHLDAILTGDGSAFEVRQLDARGGLARIMRRPGAPPAVTDASVTAFEQAMLENAQTDRQRQIWDRLFREWSYPAVQRLYDQLVADHAGNVWVRHYAIGPQESARWTLFDPAGRWLGEIDTPGALVVREIGRDYLLGVFTDELGVESVRLYTIVK
jgi:hypothetical protein